MACIDGSKVCINPFKYVGCIFNALLNLDKVAAAMAHIFVDFLQDPLGFVIEVGVAELNSIFNHVKNCYQLFKNGEPTCQKVSSFKSCVSLLLDAFDGASKVVNGLEAAKKNKVVKAIGNVQKLIPEADNMCKLGCKSSMCAADSDSEVTLQYSIPSGCQCRYMEFKNMDGPNTSTDSLMPGVFITSLASTITVTPTYCAMNAAIVNSVTGKAVSRVEFSFMGCYVGFAND